ncbi:MAG: hypothetical protein ACO1SV_12265 [Fimbriimonas sp.]
MAADAMTPKASEYGVSLKFYGPELGVFPASSAETAISTLKFNSLQLVGNEQTADFKAGQQIMSLMRIIGQATEVRGELNLTAVSSFISKYQDEGPLVEITITQDDPGDSGNEMSVVFKGLMLLPDLDFLGNPGKIGFVIQPYGVVPLVTFPA